MTPWRAPFFGSSQVLSPPRAVLLPVRQCAAADVFPGARAPALVHHPTPASRPRRPAVTVRDRRTTGPVVSSKDPAAARRVTSKTVGSAAAKGREAARGWRWTSVKPAAPMQQESFFFLVRVARTGQKTGGERD